MRALLNALGLAIWSLIALGLLAVLIFFGYEAALKLRSADTSLAQTSRQPDQPNSGLDLELPHREGGSAVPENPTEDAPSKVALGNRFLRLGELYYGFGDYPQAITAIQRGLDLGGVSHLDEAYVYLGRAALNLGNATEACSAFDRLENVPDINPRILNLWKLFADMHCRG